MCLCHTPVQSREETIGTGQVLLVESNNACISHNITKDATKFMLDEPSEVATACCRPAVHHTRLNSTYRPRRICCHCFCFSVKSSSLCCATRGRYESTCSMHYHKLNSWGDEQGVMWGVQRRWWWAVHCILWERKPCEQKYNIAAVMGAHPPHAAFQQASQCPLQCKALWDWC